MVHVVISSNVDNIIQHYFLCHICICSFIIKHRTPRQIKRSNRKSQIHYKFEKHWKPKISKVYNKFQIVADATTWILKLIIRRRNIHRGSYNWAASSNQPKHFWEKWKQKIKMFPIVIARVTFTKVMINRCQIWIQIWFSFRNGNIIYFFLIPGEKPVKDWRTFCCVGCIYT